MVGIDAQQPELLFGRLQHDDIVFLGVLRHFDVALGDGAVLIQQPGALE